MRFDGELTVVNKAVHQHGGYDTSRHVVVIEIYDIAFAGFDPSLHIPIR